MPWGDNACALGQMIWWKVMVKKIYVIWSAVQPGLCVHIYIYVWNFKGRFLSFRENITMEYIICFEQSESSCSFLYINVCKIRENIAIILGSFIVFWYSFFGPEIYVGFFFQYGIAPVLWLGDNKWLINEEISKPNLGCYFRILFYMFKVVLIFSNLRPHSQNQKIKGTVSFTFFSKGEQSPLFFDI